LKFSISNIAWPSDWDEMIWAQLETLNYQGIEIAPLKTFESGYQVNQIEIDTYLKRLKHHHLSILSMQSIIANYEGSLFASEKSVQDGLVMLEQAFSFCQRAHIPNLVFGAPRNRNLVQIDSLSLSRKFFKQAADLAKRYGVRIALEANPTIYQTDFINFTEDALNFVKDINHESLGINLDLGTMIANEESLPIILNQTNLPLIFHVHISEPFLKALDVQRRHWHLDLLKTLVKLKYDQAVSIEMAPGLSLEEIIGILKYVASLNEEVHEHRI
jgi:sugar phosphate isomerase/epimerase